MESKIFKIGRKYLTYKNLVKMLMDETFSEQFPNYAFERQMNSFYIHSQEASINKDKYNDNEENICIFLEPIKITIKKKEEIIGSFIAYSNIDIEEFCSIHEIPSENLYLNEQKKYGQEILQTLIFSVRNNQITFIFKEKEELPEIKSRILLENGKSYKVCEYSKLFKKYFGEDFNENDEFIYVTNSVRDIIFENIGELFNKDIRHFKLTGPFNIGKSITLLQFSRLCHNIFYFNLKILLTSEERDCYIIFLEEFSRLSGKLFDNVKYQIKENYSRNTKPLDFLLIIMRHLSNINLDKKFILIFDQYKHNIFSLNIQEELKSFYPKIKIVYCSSINNKKMRDECLITWKSFSGNPIQLTPENQDYYFYYSNIYTNISNDNITILNEIKSVKRFKKYYTEDKSDKEKVEAVKEHICGKLEEFSKQIDTSLDFVLKNLKSIIGKKYEIKDIEKVMKYCPLKYIIIEFTPEKEFVIKNQFNFFIQILNRKLQSNEVFNYFAKNKYLLDLIENDTVKGDYFEEAVKYGFKNNISLPRKIDSSIVLNEIATMREIDTDEFNYDYLEKKNKKYIEIQDKDDNSYRMDIESFGGNENILDIDQNMIIENDIPNKNKKNKKLKELNRILKRFSVNEENGSQVEENSLEWYRNEVLSKYKENKDYIEICNEYDGNKTYFLEQRKKQGRTLDCGLLFGEEKNKTFVGFQIKCFFDTINELKENVRDKDIIKNSIMNILVNSMFLFNCKITKWYYILIFYLNQIPGQQFCNVKKSLIEGYKNIIEIIYYDPLKQKFYDLDRKELTTLPLNDIANLDLYKGNHSMDSLDKSRHPNITFDLPNKKIVTNSFKEDLKFLGTSIDEIYKNLSKIMNINNTKYYIKNRVSNIPDIPYAPEPNKIYIYKIKEDGGYFAIRTYTEDKIRHTKAYDLRAKKEIKYYNLDCEYYYTLVKTRSYNEVKGENEKSGVLCLKPRPIKSNPNS